MDTEFEWREPEPIKKKVYRGDTRPNTTKTIGYKEAINRVPPHDLQSGMWLYRAMGSCATTDLSHAIVEADTFPDFAIHGEQEHKDSSHTKTICLLGNKVTDIRIDFGQTANTRQSIEFLTAYATSGNNVTRLTKFDKKGLFLAGQHSHTVLYNSNSLGITFFAGSWHLKNYVTMEKVGDSKPTQATFHRREFNLTLRGRTFETTWKDIPDDPEDYSGAITYVGKVWADATSNYIQCSCTNLEMDKMHLKKIAESDGFYEGDFLFHYTGSLSGTSYGILSFDAIDDLSATYYNSS